MTTLRAMFSGPRAHSWPAIVLLMLGGAVAAISQTPNQQDIVWQKSIRKYDKKRKARVEQVNAGVQRGPFQPNWHSLENYRVPEWYQDAKFGIFIHWGVYSVPAFGSEWYPREMYQQGSDEFKHHLATYGPQTRFGYKDFIPHFRAENFDAAQWAKLFRAAGAKYVVPVAEHHDGFAMYSSELTPWCAAKRGPQRDVIGELEKAVRAEGLHFGVSSHRAEHYFFMNGGRAFPSDVQDSKYASLYGPAHVGPTRANQWAGHPDQAYLDDWLARSAELVDKYRPDLVWFDWWIGQKEFEPYLQEFAAYYYNDAARRHSTAVINYKYTAFPEKTAVLDIERGQLDRSRALFWQTDTSVSNQSWGYVENDTFKSPASLIWQLVDVVSKNGSLLLNVGPRSDGTIPQGVQAVLQEIGAWLQINGEAIYGTRPWTTYGEGPTKVLGGAFNDTKGQPFTAQDIRFTSTPSALYAIAMGWPADGRLVIRSLGAQSGVRVGGVSLLGSQAQVSWSQDAQGLVLGLPSEPPGRYAFAFRITPAR
jgi:alpha-L-fucosidase